MVSLALLISYILVIPWLYFKILRYRRKGMVLYCLIKGIMLKKSLTFFELDLYIDVERKKLKNSVFLFCAAWYTSLTKPLIREDYTENFKYKEIIQEYKDIQIRIIVFIMCIFLVFGSIVFTIEYMEEGVDLLFNLIYPMI